MIDWFREWSKSIVGAVVIATIIEMILPNNNSKKYIKIVIGIFIVFTIISPMIDFLSSSDNLNDICDLDDYIEASSSNYKEKNISVKTNESIKNIYAQNLQKDITSKLKGSGYIAEYVKVEISDDGSYNINKIELKIIEKIEVNQEKEAKSIVDNIKYIVVKVDESCQGENKPVINEYDKTAIKELINKNYGVQNVSIL